MDEIEEIYNYITTPWLVFLHIIFSEYIQNIVQIFLNLYLKTIVSWLNRKTLSKDNQAQKQNYIMTIFRIVWNKSILLPESQLSITLNLEVILWRR